MCNFTNKLLISIAILVGMVIGGSIIVSSQNNQQDRAEVLSPSGLKQKPDNLRIPQNKGNQPNQGKRDLSQDIPDDVTYRQLFNHLEELNKKADQEERSKGKDGKKFRNLYKAMAQLDERKARILDKVAGDTNRELKKLDTRAKQIIDQVRSQTPNRRIERGQNPPLPPQELFELSKQRKNITTKAINDLRTNFGEAEFVRFSKFVNEKVKSGIRKKSNGAAIKKGGQPR